MRTQRVLEVRTDQTDQVVEERNDFGDEERKGRHSDDETEPDSPVGLSRVLEMVRSSESSDEAELDSEMGVDDGTGEKSGDGDWKGKGGKTVSRKTKTRGPRKRERKDQLP
jgi:hypothetical protein